MIFTKHGIILFLLIAFLISFVNLVHAADEKDVQKFFLKNKVGKSPDYAFVKNGIAGQEHLITIHGYANDKSVCEALAKEYNGVDCYQHCRGSINVFSSTNRCTMTAH